MSTARPGSLTPFAAALASLPIGAGLGVALGLWHGRQEVGEQRYGELGFSHSTYLVLREAASSGLSSGARWGLVFAVVLLLVGVAAWLRGANFGPADLTKHASSRAALGWLVAGVGVACTAALLLIEREREWLGARQVAYALAVTFATAAVLACLGRYARADVTANDPRRQATVAAAFHALALLVVAGFWINREAPEHPRDPETWIFDAVLLVAAAVVFVWSRARALATLQGRPVRAWSGPLGIGALAGGLLAALALGSGAFAGSFGAPSLHASKPLNVVFIGIDTLRADATSLYGPSLHGRDTTPNLRKLAERGVLYTNAVSQAPWTMPSFASMLTGKYPHEHGNYSLSGALREREVTLAEVLREAGYATRGVVSHTYLGAAHGFRQGFERYDESQALGHRAITSKQVTDRSIASLESAGSAPFFLFAHYFDAHYEYMDHDEWPWSDGYQGWLKNEMDFENLLKNRHLVGKPENDWLVDRYEEEIAFLDGEIGRLLAWLDAHGHAQDTLIVVAADHGEEFLDHDCYGHTTTLYQELLHVPLMVVPPGRIAPARVDTVVETRAIFGTVLDALAIDFGETSRERSLLQLVDASGPSDPKAFSIVWLPDSKLEWGKHVRISAVREGRWKVIRDYTRDKTMLFDLEADPHELHDLSQQSPAEVQRLAPVLETWTQEQQNRGGAANTVSIDARQARMLKELGYL